MRRHILVITVLCLHIAARGQTIDGLPDIDLSDLPQPTEAQALRYWFDGDGSNVQNTPLSDDTYQIDVSTLIDGLHTLHCQVIGVNDGVYSIASGVFLKMESFEKTEETVTASKLMYWFDDETTLQYLDMTGGVQMIDASAMEDGLHTLHYQVLCSNGVMTPAASVIFLRTGFDTQGLINNTTFASLRYWFDEDITAKTTEVNEGIMLIDTEDLTDGLHTVHYQIMDSQGVLCSPASAIFLKLEGQPETGIVATTAKSIRYWFDTDLSTLTVVDASQGTQAIDVSGLLSGLHTLYYQIEDSDGMVGPPATGIFLKEFEPMAESGINVITKYQYWLNDNSVDLQTVTLPEENTSYQLISLLPVVKKPIRSSSFHFEVNNGVPTMYAKNDFHIRFHDARNYFVDDSRSYIDYSVYSEVNELTLLESGIKQTSDKPAKDVVKWYQLYAETGDSLQLKLDRAATIQLFSPSGKEIYHASGAESVKWGGCHVWEAGTFYLALHDVTATYGNTVSIDYNHIDKYAVLRQDVTVVGNGGCSTITFEGNGFRDLYAVDLYNEQGDTIKHTYIGHESDATTSVVFDFTDAALGTYHAKFRFADEDKVFDNLVTVEETRDIELTTTVTYPSTFLRGTPTTYTVEITNKGNMTAYKVPVYIYIQSREENGVYNIKLQGFDFQSFLESIEMDVFSDNDRSVIKELSDSVGDDWNFVKSMIKDRDTAGDSVVVRSNYFFIDIAPGEVKKLILSLATRENKVVAHFATPHDWVALKGITKTTQEEKFNRYCCVKEGVECFVDLINSYYDIESVVITAISLSYPEVLPIAEAVSWADCAISAGNVVLKAYGDISCKPSEESADMAMKYAGKYAQSILGATLSCISAKVGGLEGMLPGAGAAAISNIDCSKIMKNIFGSLNKLTIWGATEEVINCINKFKNTKPECLPSAGGGTSTPVNSMDPNDIYGYTAESTSKAVMDGLTDVYYRIEFENDTTFATAGAHDIYVTDTLDATKFDLSTFTPTRVRIGEKSAELTGEKIFVATIDMRPEINAIAQVEGTFDEQTGIARWHISSLDPMTMEPTQYVMDGVLPVNTDGRGIGEVMYDIQLKPGLAHGTEVNNRAGIVFDNNDVIMTPTWTNVIDRIAPVSHIASVEQVEDSETGTVTIEATDELSGPWRYDVYVQYGSGAWFKAAENVAVGTAATVKLYEGVEHHFYCVATDMAGNVELKEPETEASLSVGEVTRKGDVNGDGEINAQDASLILQYVARKFGDNQEGFKKKAADANGDGEQSAQDASLILQHAAKKIDLTK